MSRTYRRMNYELEEQNSWFRQGKKKFGYYAKSDLTYISGPHHYFWFREMRKPTREEFFKEFWRVHGESKSATTWGPNKYHRKNRNRQNRNINKQELHKFLLCEDYEPLFESNPRSCLWDWD